jgi:hypothetical protein
MPRLAAWLNWGSELATRPLLTVTLQPLLPPAHPFTQSDRPFIDRLLDSPPHLLCSVVRQRDAAPYDAPGLPAARCAEGRPQDRVLHGHQGALLCSTYSTGTSASQRKAHGLGTGDPACCLPYLSLTFSLCLWPQNMGSTLGACGDVNRNVMGPAAPYVNRPDYMAAQKVGHLRRSLHRPIGTSDKRVGCSQPQRGPTHIRGPARISQSLGSPGRQRCKP